MSRPLLGLLIAILLTFAAAPSKTLAAANALSAADVSPTSGVVGTVVTLTVSYDGSHPALAVQAVVGLVTVPLTRVSGTAEHGRWAGATAPAAGTWAVAFSAVSERGNQPTLAGATITIAPLPGAPGAGTASAPASTAGPAPGSGGGGVTVPSADPPAEPVQPVASPSIDPAPLATASPIASESPAAPAGGNGAAEPPTGEQPLASTGFGIPTPSIGFGMPAPSGLDATAVPGSGASTTPAPGSDVSGKAAWLPAFVLLGVSMAAILAVVSGAFWLAGRRRRGADGATGAAAAPEVAFARPVRRTGRAVDASPGLPTKDRGALEMSGADDPIVGALGIPSETARRARRARRLRDELDERGNVDADLGLGGDVEPRRRRRTPKR